MEAEAIITQVVENEGFYAFVPFSKTWMLDKQGITSGLLLLDDSRRIRAGQRRLIHSLIADIADWNGDDRQFMKDWTKYEFITQNGLDDFSLSNCNVTTALMYTEYLIEFIIEYGVPTEMNLIEHAPHIGRYIYACLIHEKCCITRMNGAQLHHVDAVGMGNNRNDIIHLGMRVMPLLPKYHREAHDIGRDDFDAKYHVFGIKLDKYLCKVWKVKGGA